MDYFQGCDGPCTWKYVRIDCCSLVLLLVLRRGLRTTPDRFEKHSSGEICTKYKINKHFIFSPISPYRPEFAPLSLEAGRDSLDDAVMASLDLCLSC